ncbi:MAG: hypothetical protein QM658_15095 [Gordonia sp. (in: high G+C Gram-positive bacteria)]
MAEPVVVELLTHGVSGTELPTILDSTRVAAVDAGSSDGRGEFATGVDDPIHLRQPGTRIAYRWGAMTSGLPLQALWALFAPFAVVNVATWMLPESPGQGWAHAGVSLLRSVFRLLGLLLTGVFMAQLTFIVGDLLAGQCRQLDAAGAVAGGDSTACWSWLGSRWGSHDAFWRSLAVFGVVATVVLFAAAVSLLLDNNRDLRRDVRADVRGQPAVRQIEVLTGKVVDNVAHSQISRPGIASDEFVAARDARAPTLLTTHAILGIGIAALVLGGGVDAASWLLAVEGVLIAVAVLVTALSDDPRASGGHHRSGGPASRLRWMWWAFSGWRSLLWVAVSAGVLVAVVFGDYRAHAVEAHGIRTHGVGAQGVAASAVLEALLSASAVLVLVALVVVGWVVSAHRPSRGAPGPWLHGFHAPLVAAVAMALGAGAGVAVTRLVVGLVVRVPDPDTSPGFWAQVWALCRRVMSADAPELAAVRLPRTYAWIVGMWGLSACLMAAGAVVFLAPKLHRGGRRRARLASALSDRIEPRVPPTRIRDAVTWYRAEGKLLIPAAVVVASVSVLISAVVSRVEAVGGTGYPNWLQLTGTVLLIVMALGLLRAVYNGVRHPRQAGRSLGVLWDLASFWPREAHPLVPPAYAPRAIRDLEAATRSQLALDRSVILCGHSQGSLLMYAVAHRLAADHSGDDVALLTYGSQLGWAYGRAFPSALNHRTHQQLRNDLHGRWINLARFTDPLGDGVYSHLSDDGLVPYTGPDREPVRTPVAIDSRGDWAFEVRRAGPTGAGELAEVWLPDPSPGDFPAGRLRRHSEYTSDRTWDHWIRYLRLRLRS